MAHIELELLPGVGIKRLLLGDVDLTDKVSGIQLTAGAGFATRLQVELAAPVDVEVFAAEGLIEVVTPGVDESDVIVTWLDNIDPSVLDAEVLDSLGYGDDGTPITAALERLKTMARGA